VNVRLGNRARETGIHHVLLQLVQLLLQILAVELIASKLDQGADGQQQRDGSLLAIHNVFSAALLMKHNSPEAVGGFVLMRRNIGKHLIDVLARPLVGSLVLRDSQRWIDQEFPDADDLFLQILSIGRD